MLNYFIKSILTVFAVIYTLVSVGLSGITVQETEAAVAPLDEAVTKTVDTLYVLQNREDIRFELQQAFELYSKAKPDAPPFSIQTVTGEYDYESALRSKLLSGMDVDLFFISGAGELNALKPHISPLDFLPWTSRAYKPALEAVTSGGVIYGIPYSLEATGFVCNRDIFEAAGISLTGIQSFEALSEAFTELSYKIESGELADSFPELEAVCGFPAGDKAFVGGMFADIVLSGAFSSHYDAAVADAVTFPASEPAEELLKLIARHSSGKSDWPSLTKSSYAFELERLASCKTAVMLSDTNVYKQINAMNPELQGRLFLLPVPLETFETPSVYVSSPQYWAISSSSGENNKETAGDFLNWLYNSQEGAAILAEKFEAVSPFLESAESTGAVLNSQMLGYIRADMVLPGIYMELPREWARGVFALGVQDYFKTRETTWQQVISQCETSWRDEQ